MLAPRPGNAFCNPDTAPLGRRGGRPPPPPAIHDMSRREARLRRGVTSPLPQRPGIAGLCGAGEAAGANRLLPEGLRASSPVRGGGDAMPPPGGGVRASWQGCFSSSPGIFCLEMVSEVSGPRHLQPQ